MTSKLYLNNGKLDNMKEVSGEQENRVSHLVKKGLKQTKLKHEGKTYFYFLEKGYNVVLGKMLEDGSGIPDLLIFNDKDRFYVEVKNSITSALSLAQILWILKHDEKIFIAFDEGNKIRFFEINIKEVKL